MSRCMTDPAVITNIRFGYDCARYVRDSSATSTSSRLFMPTMRTKAPRGNARMPYSTSFRRMLHTRGPNPMKNCVTSIELRRAVTKWPTSCRNIDMSKPITNTNVHGFLTASHDNNASTSIPAKCPCLVARGSASPPTAPPAAISDLKRW